MADEAASNSRVSQLAVAFADALNQRAIPINGETGQQLRKLSDADFDVGWTFAGTGDVTGPGVSVDGALAVFDGTDGLTIKEGPFGTLNQVLTSNGPGVAPSFQTPAGSGTVTSVNASGGTTGLTFSGGPITGAGTLTLAGTLAPANGGTGITALGTGVATFLGTPSSANLAATVTDETGSGALVFATSPTLVTPALGTPASGVLTNTTGLPLASGVTGVLPVANGGTGVATITANGVVIGAGTSAVTTVAPGTSGNVLTSNGTAWTSAAPSGSSVQYACFRQEQPSGTGPTSDAITNGTFGQRSLNTTVVNGITGASLSSSQITGLPAGTYEVEGFVAIAAATTGSQVAIARILNVTDGTDLVVGPNVTVIGDSTVGANGTDVAYVSGTFTLAATKTISIQHYRGGSTTPFLGQSVSAGVANIYVEIRLWKVA